jgi:hypothetical protein
MGKAFGLWKQGKVLKLRLFERIAAAEPQMVTQLLRSFGKHDSFLEQR